MLVAVLLSASEDETAELRAPLRLHMAAVRKETPDYVCWAATQQHADEDLEEEE